MDTLLTHLEHLFGSNLNNLLILFLLIFTRFLAISLIMPILGAQILPSMVRIGLSICLSVTIFFSLVPEASALSQTTLLVKVMLFLKEALLGFLLGFLGSLIFFTYELVGEFIDGARAANMSKLLVPELKHQASPMGTLFFQLALTITCAFGFHRPIIAALYKSFILFPPHKTTADFISLDFLMDVTKILHVLFKIALELSFPVILISFLIDLAFGLMNRIAPQINAYFLSLPAKMMGGLLILFLVLPFLLEDFSWHFYSLLKFFNQFIEP